MDPPLPVLFLTPRSLSYHAANRLNPHKSVGGYGRGGAVPVVACLLGLRCAVNSMHSRVLSFGFVVLNARFFVVTLVQMFQLFCD